MKKIPCTVGILTYNSERNLPRALASVKDFAEIIISDGGSTDRTVEIARAHGCRVIEQLAFKNPGPVSYHPITDFAAERNQLLAAATEDWFFYIDSDEYASSTLQEEIRNITEMTGSEYYAYEIPIRLQKPDASANYRQWKQTYQVRFFNHTKLQGGFERVMHERYVFDRQKNKVGRLTGPWFVPMSKPDFFSYSRTVRYRIACMLAERPPKTFRDFVREGFFLPVRRFLGMIYRFTMMHCMYPAHEVMPWSQARNLCYSYWITCKVVWQLYWSRGRNNNNE